MRDASLQTVPDAKREFTTSNLDLAAFLMLHGVRYVGSNFDYDKSQGKPLAILRFADDKQNARDIERLFQTSSEKRYRELLKYLLKEAHQAVRDYASKALPEG